MKCETCGGCGWFVWQTTYADGRRCAAPSACADCNDDGKKPKPDQCEGCGEFADACLCLREQPQ